MTESAPTPTPTPTPTSFTCPRCGKPSHHPQDITFGYCSRCHWWTGDAQLGSAEVLALAEADDAFCPHGEVWDHRDPCPDA